jgi:hypothetical protein
MPGRGGSPACGQTHLVLVLPWRIPDVAERVGYSPPRKGGAREAPDLAVSISFEGRYGH